MACSLSNGIKTIISLMVKNPLQTYFMSLNIHMKFFNKTFVACEEKVTQKVYS